MTPKEITDQMEHLASAEDFASLSEDLVDRWNSGNVGFEAVEPILRFMEEHPSIEFGMPGALVHFVERFYHKGYEEKLLGSISRKPTLHTVWMLNRLINGTSEPATKQRFVTAMAHAKSNPLVDSDTLNQINRLLGRIGMSET